MLLNFQVIHSNCVSRGKYFSSHHISLHILWVLSPNVLWLWFTYYWILVILSLKSLLNLQNMPPLGPRAYYVVPRLLQEPPGLCSGLVPPHHTIPKFMLESWDLPAQTLHGSPWLAGRMCILKALHSRTKSCLLTVSPTVSHFTPWSHASKEYLGLLWNHGFSQASNRSLFKISNMYVKFGSIPSHGIITSIRWKAHVKLSGLILSFYKYEYWTVV